MDNELQINIDGNTYLNPTGPYGQIHGATSHVVNNLFRLDRPRMGILPPAVRWYSHDGRAFLIERPPQIMSIQYYPARASTARTKEDKEIILLPMPWTVYFIQFTDRKLSKLSCIYMYARNSPIQSMDDELFRMPLPNFLDGGQVCLGDNVNRDYRRLLIEAKENKIPLTTATYINTALTVMWQAGFNQDTAVTTDATPPELIEAAGVTGKKLFSKDIQKLLTTWEGFTLDEILKWNWPSFEGPYNSKIFVHNACKYVETIDKKKFKTISDIIKPSLGIAW